MNFLAGQILHSALAVCRRSLLLLCALGVFAASADAQIDRQCAEAAALWIPSETSPEKTVVKWNKPIIYGIAGRDEETKRSIESVLRFVARESGLQIEPDKDNKSTLDLSIAAAPDITIFASGARKYVEDYFQDAIVKRGLKGTFRIDPTAWELHYRTAAPKCAGTDLHLDNAIERAFVVVQQGETPLCIDVALGEVFGLVNIRKYYADQDREIPTQLIALAFRTLYDGRVKPGMNQSDANRVIGEVCK
jgi:hypothetical protein